MTGAPSTVNNETVSLEARSTSQGVAWYSARLRYDTTPGKPDVRTFVLRLATAPTPRPDCPGQEVHPSPRLLDGVTNAVADQTRATVTR